MDLTVLAVNVAGATAIAAIVWYFWLYRRSGVQVQEVAGVQQVPITVKGGYDPDVIAVKRGRPVRERIPRQESTRGSQMVVIDAIGQSAHLPEGETVSIEFMPETAGEIPFQCQMGMLRGKLIVQ